MARMIKIGDKVQAFWDANVSGVVTEIYKSNSIIQLTAGGPTTTTDLICKIKKSNGKIVEAKTTDLFLTEH